MKLYVWEDVLTDWTPGMVVAIAKTKKDALEAVRASDESAHRWIAKIEPQEYVLSQQKQAAAWVVWGGS